MSGKVQIVSLNCLKCGATLKITQSVTQFSCSYCGAAQAVQRSGGVIALSLITEAIQQVRIGSDKTAAELAIRRIQEEIQYLPPRRNMLGAGWQEERNLKNRSTSASFLVILIITLIIWGISVSKATGAILTGGLSLLVTGLSRKEAAAKAHCSNCDSVWHF